MHTALILFAHGARDPEWASPLRRVQAAIRQRAAGLPVEMAFLEFMTPTLQECASALIETGVKKIVVMPMFIAQGGHLKRDVPEMLASLQSIYPDVEFSLVKAIGEHEIVVQAMAEAAVLAAGAVFAGG